MIHYENVLNQFKAYITQFNLKDEMIKMKISHSYHVADLAMKLAKRLEMGEEDIALAKTLGLLHDIGRFVQYEQTKEYNDCKTKIDHGKLAVNYLFQNGHIQDFEIPKKYHEIIKKAILNHNKLEIENNLNEKEFCFASLLRDVDKIDIFRQNATSMYEWIYDTTLTNDIKKRFNDHLLIEDKQLKNKSDKLVYHLAYVFDIHFQKSYELLMETDNLELFLAVVEVKKGLEDEFEIIKKEIRNYLKERIEEKYVR